MSREHAEEFHSRLSSDEALQEKITKASDRVLEIAKEHDLHFTREELGEVMKDKSGDDDGAEPFTFILSESPGE